MNFTKSELSDILLLVTHWCDTTPVTVTKSPFEERVEKLTDKIEKYVRETSSPEEILELERHLGIAE